ncbi:MAG: hypothetical protein HC786_21310, partial [Richelia sp. CSU_2_1]|nr:hypothetical protein [Richelia sp. CSU_2_1]
MTAANSQLPNLHDRLSTVRLFIFGYYVWLHRSHGPRVKHSGIKPETYIRYYHPNASPLQIPNSQFPIPNSQFPIPNSQFPIPNSQFP